jgi:hypothetical protein
VTWTPVGAPQQGSNIHIPLFTYPVDVTTLGNIAVVEVGGTGPNSLSGGGVSTWIKGVEYNAVANSVAIFYGEIDSTGPAVPLTVGGEDACYQEFIPPSSSVAVDVSNTSNYGAVVSGVVAPVSPNESDELYVGGVMGDALTTLTGTSPGFTYVPGNPLSIMVYRAGAASPNTYSPNWADSRATANQYGTAALCLVVSESNPMRLLV